MKDKRYFILTRPFRCILINEDGYRIECSTDKEKWIEFKIVENETGNPSKVMLQSVEDGYGKLVFYREDFESSVEQGKRIIEKISDKQHVEQIIWREPLTPSVYVEHSAYVVVS